MNTKTIRNAAIAASVISLSIISSAQAALTVNAIGESAIANELLAAQGHAVDIGGYYDPAGKKANQAVRPSETFNNILTGIASAAGRPGRV